jgi:hypothetical protein
MDVFVIPVGGGRHELYCEPSIDTDTAEDHTPPGIVGRVRRRFGDLLKAAEQRQYDRSLVRVTPRGWVGRLQDRIMAWVVERIADQRLLWHLRRQTAATALHPPDMSPPDALGLVRDGLKREYDRHRRWLIIDAVILIATGVLAIVPGPNLIAYYFAFRVWGHWLSMRGAAQGLYRVQWAARPCTALIELRDLAQLEPRVRLQRIHEVAGRLRLKHLATFFDRLMVRPA